LNLNFFSACCFQGKVVALYFSAHWCPPCRQFTPFPKFLVILNIVLNFQDFYEDVGDDEFDIVFVSFDRTEDDLKEYMAEAHGDWYYIPFVMFCYICFG
ncbi:unnamed protein product, partial [Dracunculus medinensis]|uniref:Thioredoxin domain-containing protein n=1 Tax=Dracunculus medinensis TaxID=318479 RepID=A0A0N4UGL2_DRAME